MTSITEQLSEKRKFKYKLSSFEQMFNEIERVEAREAILIKYLNRVMRLAKSCKVTADAVGYDPDLARVLYEILQVMFDELSQHPDKNPGYKMMETMGVDFYEAMRKDLMD